MKFNKGELDQALLESCRNGQMHKLDDGKMVMVLAQYYLEWYIVKLYKEDCRFWHSAMQLRPFGKGKSFVPTACLNCWKVVARPRNYDETMRLLEIMQVSELDVPRKIGVESRPNVPALWGAYWYNDSLHDSLECYKRVYAEVRDAIFGDVPDEIMDKFILIKRGCTEYEQGVNGPSDTWHPFPGQSDMEKYIESKVVAWTPVDHQTKLHGELVLEKWKEWAHSKGDLSYVPYNGGRRLTPEYVTYHRESQVTV